MFKTGLSSHAHTTSGTKILMFFIKSVSNSAQPPSSSTSWIKFDPNLPCWSSQLASTLSPHFNTAAMILVIILTIILVIIIVIFIIITIILRWGGLQCKNLIEGTFYCPKISKTSTVHIPKYNVCGLFWARMEEPIDFPWTFQFHFFTCFLWWELC